MSETPKPRFRFSAKSIIVITLIVALAVAFFFYRDKVNDLLQTLADQEEQIIDYHTAHPVLVVAGAYLLYTVVTGASLPGAAIMTLLLGWFFGRVYGPVMGVVIGTVVISFASTSGATIAFLLSRFLFRGALQQKYGDRLAKFNAALEREGAFYLFTLRLIPAVPFFLINVVMGLTPIRVRTYWWVSQLGMLPGTIVYVWAGSTLPGPQQIVDEGWRPGVATIAAFVVLGVFPLAVKKIMQRFRKSPEETELPDADTTS